MTTHTFIHFCASGNRVTTVYSHDGYLWRREKFWLDEPCLMDLTDEGLFNCHILGWMHDIAVEVAYGNTAL